MYLYLELYLEQQYFFKAYSLSLITHVGKHYKRYNHFCGFCYLSLAESIICICVYFNLDVLTCITTTCLHYFSDPVETSTDPYCLHKYFNIFIYICQYLKRQITYLNWLFVFISYICKSFILLIIFYNYFIPH